MNRIRYAVAAVLIALMTWYYAIVRPPDADEPEDSATDDEMTQPITPAYAVPSVYNGLSAELDKRKQADLLAAKQAARERLLREEQARQAAAERRAKQAVVSRSKEYVGRAQTYEATFYTAHCPTGCTGITASGYDVRNTIYTPDGLRIIAVDPRVIPLGSLVELTFTDGTTFKAQALDTGGAIKGLRVDVLVKTRAEAYRLGRQSVEIRMIRRGGR